MLISKYRKEYIYFKLDKTIRFAIKAIIISLIAILISYKIKITILKFVVFGAVYLGFWAKTLYKNKMEVF